MEQEELTARLDTPVNFQMVSRLTEIIQSNDLDVNDLLEISFHPKKEVGFRAAWMLEYITVNDPEKFEPHFVRLLELLPAQKNPSAMRHFTKIISLVTDKKAAALYKFRAEQTDFEAVIETLFTWLVDPEMLVAAKVHCMQSLANLAGRYEWIKDDLPETIDYLMDIESIAFFARAKMVKKQLAKLS